ncbi:SDR family oxidoreductase [Deltaproteobacteria bacterium]|nr:SDR family oxidoreductase [Deltaproteobacteria bacterium]
MKKILITGATGLLGSSLVPYLKKCGHKIVTHARTTQADLMFDLSDRIKSFEILEHIQPRVIINLVSLTSVELCEKQVNLAYLANTLAVENLTHWIESNSKECHLVQISTDHLYDGVGPFTEDDITITNNYAFSKYAGELAAIRVPSTILRTNFVGRSQVSRRESMTDWVYNAMKTGEQLKVLNDVYFSPLSITKLVEMIELVLQKEPVGIFNLGSHNGMSKADFDFAFAECLKLPTNTMTRIQSSQAKFLEAYRPKDMRLDSSKFENTLDIKLPSLTNLIQKLAQEYYEIA